MSRIPELVVFLVLPLVGMAVHQNQQALLFGFGPSFHADRLEVAHGWGREERYQVWASPPGPVRDVLRAGVPGVAMAGLAVLLAGAAAGTLVTATRRPGRASGACRRGGTMALRMAILVSLIAIGTGTFCISELWMGFYRAHATETQLFDRLAPGIAILRLGAGLSAVAVGVALFMKFVEVHAVGRRR